MDNIGNSGGSPDFQQELLAFRNDPRIRSFVRKLAGEDRDLTEDVWQAAMCAAATVKHPERIADRRAYFVTVLKHEAYRLYVLGRPAPVENPETALGPGQHATLVFGPAPARPIDETVATSLLIESLLKRLAALCGCLRETVPARSDDPGRYVTVIYFAAEQILLDGRDGEPSDADSNDAFRVTYPEYFAQLHASANLLHQRFRRAREDVKALLKAVVRHDELI